MVNQAFFLLVLAFAMSLQCFSKMIIEGAMLVKVNYLEVAAVGVMYGLWQSLVLLLTQKLTVYLISTDLAGVPLPAPLMRLIAMLIYICLALYMFYKGQKEKQVHERRADELSIRRILYGLAETLIVSVGVGTAMTFSYIPVTAIMLPLVLVSLLMSLAGIAVGRVYGSERHDLCYDLAGILYILLGLAIRF